MQYGVGFNAGLEAAIRELQLRADLSANNLDVPVEAASMWRMAANAVRDLREAKPCATYPKGGRIK